VTLTLTMGGALARQLHDTRAQHTGPWLLELDLTEPLVEEPPADLLGWAQTRRRGSLRSVLRGLRDAGTDPRVRGLVVKVGGRRMPLARAQELGGAIADFRATGKPTLAWAETFGEFGPGSVPYLLACQAGEVWLHPSGDVGLTGVAVEAVFLREALDRVGIEPQIERRHEYKNAADLFLERGFTAAHREAVTGLAESASRQLLDTVAAARGLSVDRVRELVDRAPLFAEEALEAGLVDRLGYRDEVYAQARRRAGDGTQLLYLSRYRRAGPVAAVRTRSRPGVAVVSATGGIRLGRSGRSPLSGSAAGSDTVTAALRAAARDDSVRAVVFRVTSPGGSYVASDAIWREVGEVRAAGKPVVVSMGEVAASGGYFVAMGADLVVALPGTLTGSIGVLGGKAVLADLLHRAGVGVDGVGAGRHARMFSPRTRFSDEELRRLADWLDRVYRDFVGKVAAGRGLPVSRAEELARGRVWTGADARTHGLVDELGGLPRAVAIARDRAGLPADAPARPVPRPDPVRRLHRPRSSEEPAAAAVGLTGWDGWDGLAAALGLPAAGPLLMPPLRLR
jgi:protease-4